MAKQNFITRNYSLDQQTIDELKRQAKENTRSLSHQIRYLIWKERDRTSFEIEDKSKK